MAHHAGDKGKTLLSTPTPIGKDDIRIEAIGALDELLAALRFAALVGSGPSCPRLARITAVITRLSEYVHSGGKAVLLPKADEINELEETAARLATPSAPVGIALCEASARNDQAAAVCRRAERALVRVSKVYTVAEPAIAYLNRLSDFLTARARHADYMAERGEDESTAEKPVKETKPNVAAAPDPEGIVRAVLAELGEKPMMTLDEAKRLIEGVEAYAKAEGKRAVIAVCNTEGNPIAVHVMDGAYLVSFDVAVKKAYTAVAVKMPTRELAALVARGGTFQGLDKITDLVTFGGGVPLYRGGVLAGGIGISGGTGDEDHALCEFAVSLFEKL